MPRAGTTAIHKVVVVLAVAVTLVVASPERALACTTSPPDKRPTLNMRLEEADAAFVGTVVHITTDESEPDSNGAVWIGETHYRFRVDRVVKGDLPKFVTISSYGGDAMCAFGSKLGKRHALLLDRTEDGRWSEDSVDERKLLRAAEQSLSSADRLPQDDIAHVWRAVAFGGIVVVVGLVAVVGRSKLRRRRSAS